MFGVDQRGNQIPNKFLSTCVLLTDGKPMCHEYVSPTPTFSCLCTYMCVSVSVCACVCVCVCVYVCECV
jgi:hypothetical protein